MIYELPDSPLRVGIADAGELQFEFLIPSPEMPQSPAAK